nr:hypothetical protein [uncultured Duganella sp.]
MEIQELEKFFATKVELMAFREEVAVQFGKVHVEVANLHTEIAKLETRIAAMEVRIIKWFVALAISNATISLAIARYLS